jgi:peptidoglycan hydrolase FlgJ
MAIKPSSDIILEVLKAADPARAQAVTQRLTALGAGAAGGPDDFAKALEAAAPAAPADAPPAPDGADMRERLPMIGVEDAEAAKAARTQIDFEASILKSLVDEILPKDEASVYGDGTAGDIWKSMLSDQIARKIAKSGAFGIARQLFATHPLRGRHLAIAPSALADAATLGAGAILDGSARGAALLVSLGDRS